MANPGETIQGLEICIENIDKVECPEECPYYKKCIAYDRRCVFQPLLRDTLAILKAQQERIKELEELLHEGGCDGINACDVKACPYYNASHVQLEETKDEKIRELQKEIHKLKAAQEPRVMTLEEVAGCVALERETPIYMEFGYLATHAGQVIGLIPKYMYFDDENGLSWNVCEGPDQGKKDGVALCEYNDIWRCWTSRPTDEQREATPWD